MRKHLKVPLFSLPVIFLLLLSTPLFSQKPFSRTAAIDLEVQTIETALLKLGETFGFNVTFPAETAAVKSPAIKGQYSFFEALDALLLHTGMAYNISDGEPVVIRLVFKPTEVDSNISKDSKDENKAIPPPETPAPNQETSNKNDIGETGILRMEEIVVTGTSSRGLKKMDASFAITSKSLEEIQATGPLSTADILRVSPGIWVESSGGESGANIAIRGFPSGSSAPFVQFSVDGIPIYADTTLDFFENSSILRLDETFERVEILRGGPNPIYSGGNLGATVNFITKIGTRTPQGVMKYTGSDYGLNRIDLQYSGPINKNWVFSVGGFYRTSDGIRETEYPSDRGGQYSANLTRILNNGHITIFGRRLDEKNAFITPIPLRNPANPRAFSNDFDPNFGTYHSNDFRFVQLEVGNNEFIRRDLADGRGAKMNFFGGELDIELDNGWHVLNKFNYSGGDVFNRSPFPGALPTSAADFLADTITKANNNAAVLAAAGGIAATSGNFSFANSGNALTDMNQQLMSFGLWTADKKLESFINDLRVDRTFGDHFLTLGIYFADWSDRELWYLGNNVLATAQENSRLINLTLDNGVEVTRDGFVGAPTLPVNARHHGRRVAFYASDEWQINNNLRLDFGFRVENYRANTTTSNGTLISGVDLDNNPLTLANNNATVFSDRSNKLSFNKTKVSYTVGTNYTFNDQMAIFARFNSGVHFPTLSEFHFGKDFVQDVKQYELGFKMQNAWLGAFVTFYYVDFKNIAFNNFIEINGVIQQVQDFANVQTPGIELELVANMPLNGLQVAFTGTFQDPELKDFQGRDASGNIAFDNSGNQVQRQPKIQFRIAPSYSWNRGQLLFSYTWVDDRFSDNENTQVLPSYFKLDASARLQLTSNLSIQVVADNLTNEIGLTEGNPRVIGSGVNNGVFLARPLFGRSVRTSVAYHF